VAEGGGLLRRLLVSALVPRGVAKSHFMGISEHSNSGHYRLIPANPVELGANSGANKNPGARPGLLFGMAFNQAAAAICPAMVQ
jgi:hypothetical protein